MTQLSLPDRYYSGRFQVRPRHGERFIASILSNRKLYGDGPPRWRQGKSRKRCKSAAEAETDRKKLVKVLRKYGGSPEALHVADRLVGCRPEARCHSGACPCCMRAFQRWLVIASNEMLKRAARQGISAKILSIIPTKAPHSKGRTLGKRHDN